MVEVAPLLGLCHVINAVALEVSMVEGDALKNVRQASRAESQQKTLEFGERICQVSTI